MSKGHFVENPSGQRVSLKSGRIKVGFHAWIFRVIALSGYAFLVGYMLYDGVRTSNWLGAYSFIAPLNGFLILFFGWVFYRSPGYNMTETTNTPSRWIIATPLISIIIPIYNQRTVITQVVEAVSVSTYKNIEIIAVNDGSIDNTGELLDKLVASGKYPKLKVIHQANGGKRKAVANGFYHAKGKFVMLIDSDSIIDSHAVEEFMKAFLSDPKIGGAVGHVKVANAGKNWLTKFQDTWYDYSFNIAKSMEAHFGAVICISGCLAAYRREAIERFMPFWSESTRIGEDKELTMYAFAPPKVKTQLESVFGEKFWVPTAQRFMESAAAFDDSEDRSLSAHSIIEWKNTYVASALAYTEVPDVFKQFCKQQIRWMKSFVRTNLFLNTFYWKKPPFVAFHYYIQYLSTITMPLLTVINYVYVPFVLGNWIWSLTYLGATVLVAFALGMDYKFRDPKSKYWYYHPFQLLFTSHFVTWLIFPALLTYKDRGWGTRKYGKKPTMTGSHFKPNSELLLAGTDTTYHHPLCKGHYNCKVCRNSTCSTIAGDESYKEYSVVCLKCHSVFVHQFE